MIAVERLHKTFDGNTPVLEDITFTLGTGESLSIVGPSGCGKTTLLYILSGLLPPTSGSVVINNHKAGVQGDVAFILQDFGLLPWRTVWENICLGMKIRGLERKVQIAKGERALVELGLIDERDRYPACLSGGEKQRIAIGRALTLDARLLLMDEPFSSLDTLTREGLQELLLKIWINRALTMVLVTHSIEEAVFLGGAIMVLDSRPGRIKEIIPNPNAGTPGFRDDAAFHDACRRVRRLLEN